MAWQDEASGAAVGASDFWSVEEGESIASASSITITDGAHRITGSTTINTIVGGRTGQVILLTAETGATWAFGAAGNIKAAAGARTAERWTALRKRASGAWEEIFTVLNLADAITFTPHGRIAATTVQDALEELIDESPAIPVAIADGGTGQTAKDEAFDALAPTTTRGDFIVMGSAGDNVRLPVGAAGTVLAGGATDPAYTADPTVTSLTATTVTATTVVAGDGAAGTPSVAVGSTSKGLYEIGASELGVAIAGVGEVSFTASRIAPVTDLGQTLGDSTKRFAEAWTKRDYGWASKSLSTTLGGAAQNFLTAVIAAPDTICAFQITTVIASKMGTLYSSYDSSGEIETWNVIICRDSTTTYTTTISSSVGSAASAGTGGGTSSGTLAASAGSDIVTFTMTTAGAGTPVEVTLYYKITVICGSPTFAEV